ncbi:hypothetical protein PUMCH_000700 [Australozyma saopauloensis]|uniref:Kinetochore protein Spc24 n=1 Tax=Australozyma saopauloensis TaxID=291208 RepID=A0AAX4H534_9ASCO|nr:hypothetical protein PUMCH_000700 [[Candida] saopauloensis]
MNNESPAELIRMTAGGFAIKPDTLALEQIARLLDETAQLRHQKEEALRQELESEQAELQRLSAEMAETQRPGADLYELLGVEENRRDPENDDIMRLFRARLLELDNDKIALAKQLTELQSVVNQLKQTRLQLQKRQEELQRLKEDAVQSNVAEHYNSTSMKIALYKKLGVHVESTSEGDKILVIDKLTNQASVLEVDPKYSDYFISNWVWDKIASPAKE